MSSPQPVSSAEQPREFTPESEGDDQVFTILEGKPELPAAHASQDVAAGMAGTGVGGTGLMHTGFPTSHEASAAAVEPSEGFVSHAIHAVSDTIGSALHSMAGLVPSAGSNVPPAELASPFKHDLPVDTDKEAKAQLAASNINPESVASAHQKAIQTTTSMGAHPAAGTASDQEAALQQQQHGTEGAGGLVSGLVGGIVHRVEDVVHAVTDMSSRALHGVESTVGAATGTLKDTWAHTVSATQHGANEGVEGAKQAAHQAWERSSETAHQVGEKSAQLAESAPEAISDRSHQAMESLKSAGDAARETAEQGMDRAKSAVESARHSAAQGIDRAKHAVEGRTQAIRDTAAQQMQRAKESADSLRASLAEGMQHAKEKGAEMTESARDMAAHGMERTKQAAASAADSTRQATDSAASTAEDIARGVAQGSAGAPVVIETEVHVAPVAQDARELSAKVQEGQLPTFAAVAKNVEEVPTETVTRRHIKSEE